MLVVSVSHSVLGEATAGHNLTVWSWLAEARRLPSGLNATLSTRSVWPVIGSPTGWPVSAFHSRIVASLFAVASRSLRD